MASADGFTIIPPLFIRSNNNLWQTTHKWCGFGDTWAIEFCLLSKVHRSTTFPITCRIEHKYGSRDSLVAVKYNSYMIMCLSYHLGVIIAKYGVNHNIFGLRCSKVTVFHKYDNITIISFYFNHSLLKIFNSVTITLNKKKSLHNDNFIKTLIKNRICLI